MNDEQWKPVIGFEDYYAVSNEGRVRSLDRYVEREKGGKCERYLVRGKILKNRVFFSRKRKNARVAFVLNGERVEKIVARLVWETFAGPIPDGKWVMRRLYGCTQPDALSNLVLLSAEEYGARATALVNTVRELLTADTPHEG